MTRVYQARLAVTFVLALAVGAGAAGCGTGKSTTTFTGKERMEEIREMLKTVAADGQKPPARIADLGNVEPMIPQSALLIRSGEIVYVWGATLSGGNAVIAYEKQVPAEGGWVLLQDGTVKTMTAEQFKAAPKPGR